MKVEKIIKRIEKVKARIANLYGKKFYEEYSAEIKRQEDRNNDMNKDQKVQEEFRNLLKMNRREKFEMKKWILLQKLKRQEDQNNDVDVQADFLEKDYL